MSGAAARDASLEVGAVVRFAKPALQHLLDALAARGYRTVGPVLRDGAIVYGDLARIEQLPSGWRDEQDGGRYRLVEDASAGYFSHVVGPNSLKNYLFPPRETLLTVDRTAESWAVAEVRPAEPPVAVIGARSCDLAAVAIQDRVFLEGPFVDPAYLARRRGLFVAAVHCGRGAATCFCHSLDTGPEVRADFDLVLTELPDRFLAEVGTAEGAAVLGAVPWEACAAGEAGRARQVPQDLRQAMHARQAVPGQPRPRHLDTQNIRDLLLGNPLHPRWDAVAQRCLDCANCTLVCPTCFCSTVEEVSDLTGDHVSRQRSWSSCFLGEHSYTAGGTVRKTVAARYRQWLTHKLASWIDQYGVSGCVGCGRCITWCPVAIDLTDEVAAIRQEA